MRSPVVDPYKFVLSANLHRRHLTAEQKRDLITKVLKAKPDASNRQIAAQVKADDKTVGKIRKELEATAEIPQLEKTTGADGKARKKAVAPAPKKPQPVVPAPDKAAAPVAVVPDQTEPVPTLEQTKFAVEVLEAFRASTVDSIKADLVRFDDENLDELRAVIEAEIADRKPGEPRLKGRELVERRTVEARGTIVSFLREMEPPEQLDFIALLRLQLDDLEAKKRGARS